MSTIVSTKTIRTTLSIAGLLMVLLPFQNCGPGFTAMNSADLSSLNMTQGLTGNKAFGKSGLRRLTRTEYRNSLNDIFGVDPSSIVDQLPEDIAATSHFDNEFATQSTSSFTVLGYNMAAETYAAMVAADANLSTRLAGCAPKTVNDYDCFISFAKKVGRKVLRRAVTDADAAAYAQLLLPFAQTDMRFNSALELLVQAFVQHPAFLYRIEAGEDFRPEPGVLQLRNFEIATRLSYLIWGSAPDDALLDAAEQGKLKDESERIAQATRLLNDQKAVRQIRRFHSQWLGYESAYLPPTVEADLRQESDMLISKVVFDLDRDWLEIFNWKETYVSPALARHYGMPAVSQTGWTPYSGKRGGGIFAHGTIATLGAKFGDTSPTLRGYQIFKRVMCGRLGAVPPGVDTDTPPGNPTDCKEKRYSMRQMTTCASCHQITDNIGFGLENYGAFGEWRDTETTNSSCAISGTGSINQVAYSGPKALGELMAKNPVVAQCATKQLFRFFSGRVDTQEDALMLESLNMQYYKTPSLKSLLLAMVKSPGFMHKSEGQP